MLNDQDRINIVRFRIENAESTLAESLEQIANGYYNTAVNRMYYACYYAASALLITKSVVTKTHDGVLQMLSLHFIKTGVCRPNTVGYTAICLTNVHRATMKISSVILRNLQKHCIQMPNVLWKR